MKVDIRKKLEGKSAYIALALLLTMIIAFTVIAIIASVNSQEEPTPPPVNNEEIPAPEGEGDATTGGDVSEPDKAPDTETDVTPEPEAPVYITPCEGHIQKDYSDTALVFSQTMNDHRIHLGVDIAGKLGDPVKAFCKGVIEKIFTDRFMGKTIIINHGSGLKSVYMNLSDTLPDGIKEGSEIEAGAVIGAIGETAANECADSPHLHFELRLGDKKVDPKDYVTLPSSSDSEDIYEG